MIYHRFQSHLGDKYEGVTHPIEKDSEHQYRHGFQVKHKIGLEIDFIVQFDESELQSTKKICKTAITVPNSNCVFQDIRQLCLY